MSFVQWQFLVFFWIIFVAYWARPTRIWQNAVLTFASIVFYGWITPWWVLLLLGSATIDFLMGQLMVRSPQHRKVWLAISLSANLGSLLYFKYFGFFVDNVAFALTQMGMDPHLSTLEIALPAGISFYTFQTMSYTLDIYRREVRPRKSFLDYIAFVSFFPQLVAGPIERASRLLPQLEVARVYSTANFRNGLGLALYGAFKKLALADTIAPYVDKVFVLQDPSGPLIWIATIGFSCQVYADFSGYTDIARGTAQMLGVHLVKNFDEPYLARSTPEFWQRWHMSLSGWIRDYMLTPLLGSGSVITPGRFAGAVFITMIVIGAWHGAGWNYIAFGVFHAIAILAYVMASRLMPERAKDIPGGNIMAMIFHTLVIGQFGALMFREPSLARFFEHISKNPFVATIDDWRVVIVITSLIVFMNFTWAIEHVARRTIMPKLENSPWELPVQSAVWSVWSVLIVICYREASLDFVYFQF